MCARGPTYVLMWFRILYKLRKQQDVEVYTLRDPQSYVLTLTFECVSTILSDQVGRSFKVAKVLSELFWFDLKNIKLLFIIRFGFLVKCTPGFRLLEPLLLSD